LSAVVGLGTVGLLCLRGLRFSIERPAIGLFGLVFGIALVAVFAFDVLEAMAPPTDADSLAYHFALPKKFIQAGEIVFVPHALTGAIPMLVQITYVPALALGGEIAMTFWMLISGWAAIALLYVLSRAHVNRTWSLAAAAVFASTPAVVYGAGSGQVEVRLALFVMLAAWAVGRAWETGEARYAVLAGLACGFFGGAKFTGPIFMLVTVLVLMAQRDWFRHAAIASSVALVACFQWYLWNWLNTGDPLFPFLYNVLGVTDPTYWNAENDALFRSVNARVETPYPVTLWTWLTYPFFATFDPHTNIESGRTGFGPVAFVLLLPAIMGAWMTRHRMRKHPVWAAVAIAILFYTVAFFMGAPQRTRHLLPIWPLIILAMMIAAERLSQRTQTSVSVLSVLVIVIGIQGSGAVIFASNFLNVAIGQIDRNAFLREKVSFIEPVFWINENLGPNDILMTNQRTQLYYLDVPYFFAHPIDQTRVPWALPNLDPQEIFVGMKQVGVTHLLSDADDSNTQALSGLGCLNLLYRGSIVTRTSRTLPGSTHRDEFTISLFQPKLCP